MKYNKMQEKKLIKVNNKCRENEAIKEIKDLKIFETLKEGLEKWQ